jgi:phospho-N-acetylmuramoyl-pentapeptide-transferase
MLIFAAATAFTVTAISGCAIVPMLRHLHFGQTIRESGPTWHNKKQGTPTMGGFCFILGLSASLALTFSGIRARQPDVLGDQQLWASLLVLFLAFGSGLIGFLDDFIKVARHRNLGLQAWQKLLMQFAVTFGFLAGLRSLGLMTTIITLPLGGTFDLGVAYYPIAFFGIIFMVNAVNLTDGLDGLCTSVTFVCMLGYVLGASLLGFYHASVLATAMAGACAGFLIWNFNPAKTFMGDTGSMFLGGIVTGLAFIICRPELILFFGIVYIWDAMTVVIQRLYFKATHGKRIFRMTPIHHAFEMRGWNEIKIGAFFCMIGLMGAVLGILYIYLG